MKEQDIRPEDLFAKYVELSALDADECFIIEEMTEVNCVACDSSEFSIYSNKQSFRYVECKECKSVFVSPRPSQDSFYRFYKDSKYSNYWAEVFYPMVAEARREKIFIPRVKMLSKICNRKNIRIDRIIDIGAGYGVFLDEWLKENPKSDCIAVEPSKLLADECRAKGLNVEQFSAEELTGFDQSADLVVCFEVLEHVHNPLAFVKTLKRLLKPGGWLFLSTLCIDGFDLSILRDRSAQISPPHHINFMSVKGFQRLFNRARLNDIDITTPGKLDVDIVRNFKKKNPGKIKLNHFLDSILDDDDKANAFQLFLSENQLSSHIWVLGKTEE